MSSWVPAPLSASSTVSKGRHPQASRICKESQKYLGIRSSQRQPLTKAHEVWGVVKILQLSGPRGSSSECDPIVAVPPWTGASFTLHGALLDLGCISSSPFHHRLLLLHQPGSVQMVALIFLGTLNTLLILHECMHAKLLQSCPHSKDLFVADQKKNIFYG